MFTVPKPLRLVLARDPAWARWVGQLVVRAIGAWQRRIARARGLRAPRTGAVVFIAVVTDPTIARTLLVALDLPHEPSAFAPARDPPQAELEWDDPA